MERGGAVLKLTIYGQPCGAGSKTAEVVTRKGNGPLETGMAKWLARIGIIPFGKVPVMKDGRYILRYRHATKGTEAWMRAVTREAQIAWRGLEPVDEAVWLDVLFYENRPSTHYFQRKSGPVLRPDAPAFPARTDTHDSDKMRRAICDSLTNAGVLADDKRVIGGELWKDYVENLPLDAEGREPKGREPKAVIRVGRMKAQTVTDLGIVSPTPDGQQSLFS